jgi:predicted transposase/invertase (TIGR01784 family)
MLMTEFNLDDAIAVAKEEGKEEAIEERNAEIIQNAFANGLPIDIICKITGLDMNTVRTLGSVQNIYSEQ